MSLRGEPFFYVIIINLVDIIELLGCYLTSKIIKTPVNILILQQIEIAIPSYFPMWSYPIEFLIHLPNVFSSSLCITFLGCFTGCVNLGIQNWQAIDRRVIAMAKTLFPSKYFSVHRFSRQPQLREENIHTNLW